MHESDPGPQPPSRLRRWLASVRLQAGLLAALLACIWWVIGLLTGIVLAYLVAYLSPPGSETPARVLLVVATLVCGGYGMLRGWRLYRLRVAALD